MQGTVVDSKYQIVRRLGEGGMGAVYEARHLGTGRRVAVKVIAPAALLNDEDSVPRFQREARASGAIDSQHVVQVLDTGVDPQTNSPYLVMEHLTGEDLLQLVHRVGPLVPDVVLRIVAQACSGLARAHREGIVHRDIKSANLFLSRREDNECVVKILDFGIAKVRVDPLSASTPQSITRTGAMLGSPLYMPPEQVKGTKDVDPRSDVFSLGVTMYEALCGLTPNHEIDTIGALIFAICAGNGRPLQQRAPWVPRAVAAIVERALALEPGARWQSAAEMQAAIQALLPAEGRSLHEAMLVGVPLALRSTVAPTVDDLLFGLERQAAVARHAAPSQPVPATASTATAFVDSKSESPRKLSSWLLAFPVALVALVVIAGGGIGVSRWRAHGAAPAPGPSAPLTPLTTEPVPSASTTLPSPLEATTTSPSSSSPAAAPASAVMSTAAAPTKPAAVPRSPVPTAKPAPVASSVQGTAGTRVAPPASAKKAGILDTSE